MVAHTFPDPREAMNYLKTMSVDRNEHERRRKFIEDCQRIHNRRKYAPCIPILPGHDQELWFAKLEANGIWEMVFQYLTNPSDVESAYHACGLFREHLEERRKMMMIQKIFKVLRRTRHLEFKGFRRVSDNTKAVSRDVLNQRLVSKVWKKSVDEEFLIPLDLSRPIWHPHSWDLWHDNVCKFKCVRDVASAMESLCNTSSCTSLRLLVVFDSELEGGSTNAYYSKLEEFLDIHGHDVWGFKFWQSRREKDFCYKGLRRIVSKMSNLKALWVQDIIWFGRGYQGAFFRDQLEEASARLRTIIAQKPFPTIPTLELCSLDFYGAQNESLIVEIFRRNPHIRAVELPDWALDRIAVIPGFVWDTLQNLRLEYFHLGHNGRSHIFVEHILRLSLFDWPLKQLVLRHSNLDREVDVTVPTSTVFRLLAAFKDSLEIFYFQGGGLRFVNDPVTTTVDFSRLKWINFRNEIDDE